MCKMESRLVSHSIHPLQAAEALKERAKRIYDKYGNVMLDVGVRRPPEFHFFLKCCTSTPN